MKSPLPDKARPICNGSRPKKHGCFRWLMKVRHSLRFAQCFQIELGTRFARRFGLYEVKGRCKSHQCPSRMMKPIPITSSAPMAAPEHTKPETVSDGIKKTSIRSSTWSKAERHK